MAIALRALQRVAFGQEVTPGTAVDPSRIVPHLDGSTFSEEESREPLPEPRGVLAMVDDVLTRRVSNLGLQQELDWDHCLPVFLAGIDGDTPSGTGPYEWEFDVGVTAPADPAAFTVEVRAASDGSTLHVLRRFSHARVTQWGIEWQDGGTTRLTSTWMGGAAVTPNAEQVLAASGLATRRVVPASLWSVAIDDAWGSLGGTLAETVRGIGLSVETGWTPSYHYRGRPLLDLDGWYPGLTSGEVTLTYDLDARAAEEVAHWRAGDLRFVQLQATNGETGAAERSITVKGAGRVVSSPELLASDGEQSTVELAIALRSDAAGAADDILEVDVKSALSAWARVAVPNVPRTVAAAAGDDALTVTWTAPAGGGAVTRYRVRHRIRGSGARWTEATVASGTLTLALADLVSVATYDVEVRAENNGGASAWVAVTGTTT